MHLWCRFFLSLDLEQSVTFIRILTQTNIRNLIRTNVTIYSYRRIYINECQNIFIQKTWYERQNIFVQKNWYERQNIFVQKIWTNVRINICAQYICQHASMVIPPPSKAVVPLPPFERDKLLGRAPIYDSPKHQAVLLRYFQMLYCFWSEHWTPCTVTQPSTSQDCTRTAQECWTVLKTVARQQLVGLDYIGLVASQQHPFLFPGSLDWNG